MELYKSDLPTLLEKFLSNNDPFHRYASWDYCYNYFQNNRKNDLLIDIEKSCLVIGFYLASWGMFRGSSFLLKTKSLKHFEKLIRHLAEADPDLWEIDVSTYNENSIAKMIKEYLEVKLLIVPDKNSHLTLVTKILHGVFGFTPAFDQYFTLSMREIFKGQCGFTRFNADALWCIKQFYDANNDVVDYYSSRTTTIDLFSGSKTQALYPTAKIIDMYGFQKSYDSALIEAAMKASEKLKAKLL